MTQSDIDFLRGGSETSHLTAETGDPSHSATIQVPLNTMERQPDLKRDAIEQTDQKVGLRYRQLSISAMAFSLCALAVFVRGFSLYYPIRSYWDARWIVRESLHRSYYDVLTISCATFITILVLYFAQRLPKLERAIVGLYYIFAGVMGLLLCVNSRALEIIGGPLTYQWLYYADFLRSFTSRSAVASNVDSSFVVLLAFSLVVLTIGQWGVKSLLSRTLGNAPFLLSLSALLMVAYLIHGWAWVRTADDYREIANPLVELVSTALAGDTNTLSSLPTGISDMDFRIGSAAGSRKGQYDIDQKVKNVVLVVMESVGADYVIGSKSGMPLEVTPELTKARRTGIAFENFYAHAPMSTKSLFSILGSRYPLFSYQTEISKIGNYPLATLSSQLKKAGYRTAFFMSGDFRFQNVNSFLVGRGFDVLADMNTIPCSTPTFAGSTTAWPNLDSVDDTCSAEALSKWIGDGKGAPFFAMMWTGNTHWPYFGSDEQLELSSENPHFNRYLNALRSSDSAVGTLFKHLSQQGLWDETLVVVIGDHGEAFGQHGSQVHGNSIFEEEVHIPLLLLSPSLFRGERSRVIGGLVDLAPTILDLLKIEAPPSWQGRSMFAIERSQRVYFMVPNSEMIAGYKEGDTKFIFNLARNRISVFDLEHDPGETQPLAKNKEVEREVSERLAAWVQYQQKLFSAQVTSLH